MLKRLGAYYIWVILIAISIITIVICYYKSLDLF